MVVLVDGGYRRGRRCRARVLASVVVVVVVEGGCRLGRRCVVLAQSSKVVVVVVVVAGCSPLFW